MKKLFTSLLILCMPFTAIAAPTINNDGGASNVTVSAADLNGNLTSTGGVPTYVWVFWGTNDAGTATNDWMNTNSFGTLSEGLVTTNVTDLIDGTVYYYRYYASNSVDVAWASSTTNFRTGYIPDLGTIRVEQPGGKYKFLTVGGKLINITE
jgi:hypothetical protein